MLVGHLIVSAPISAPKVCLFDPGLDNNSGQPSGNLGDLVIQQAVDRELRTAIGDFSLTRISTHETPTPELRRALGQADFIVVGGSNILTSEMNVYRQWVISIRHAFAVRRAILLGAGWWKYQNPPNLYTRFFFRLLLSRKHTHSVRDGYTLKQLAAAGWKNAVNTGCPTIWPLDGRSERDYPGSKAANVLLMLSDFAPDLEADRRLAEILSQRYEKVFVFPQGKFDLDYLRNFQMPWIVLDRDIGSLNRFLADTPSLDYIGTRLHGGIHCLNRGIRSLILEVDNRATEMGRDFGLPTVARHDFAAIEAWTERTLPFRVHLDTKAIETWRKQFRKSKS